MADKATGLEERFNRLEEKLRITFVEIEKRLVQQQNPQQQYDYEGRMQELEDLILLLQLENTKLKERVGGGLDFGIVPVVPDISERITRIESELASRTSDVPIQGDIDAKMATLEARINSPNINAEEKKALSNQINELEKKVRTLEALLAKHGREELEEESRLLDDVRHILRG